MTSLFPDSLAKAEEEINHHDDNHYSIVSSKMLDWYHPYHQAGKHQPEGFKKSVTVTWKKQHSHLELQAGEWVTYPMWWQRK